MCEEGKYLLKKILIKKSYKHMEICLLEAQFHIKKELHFLGKKTLKQ
jgi:hypothetical protein